MTDINDAVSRVLFAQKNYKLALKTVDGKNGCPKDQMIQRKELPTDAERDKMMADVKIAIMMVNDVLGDKNEISQKEFVDFFRDEKNADIETKKMIDELAKMHNTNSQSKDSLKKDNEIKKK